MDSLADRITTPINVLGDAIIVQILYEIYKDDFNEREPSSIVVISNSLPKLRIPRVPSIISELNHRRINEDPTVELTNYNNLHSVY